MAIYEEFLIDIGFHDETVEAIYAQGPDEADSLRRVTDHQDLDSLVRHACYAF